MFYSSYELIFKEISHLGFDKKLVVLQLQFLKIIQVLLSMLFEKQTQSFENICTNLVQNS